MGRSDRLLEKGWDWQEWSLWECDLRITLNFAVHVWCSITFPLPVRVQDVSVTPNTCQQAQEIDVLVKNRREELLVDVWQCCIQSVLAAFCLTTMRKLT